MRPYSLAYLISRTRSEIELGVDPLGYVNNVELIDYLNASYAELYALEVQATEGRYGLRSNIQIGPIVQGQQFYNLPTDFLKMYGVDISFNAGANQWFTVYPFQFNQRNMYTTTIAPASLPGYYNLTRYDIRDDQLTFIPNQGPAPNQIQVHYTPCPPTLVSSPPLPWASGTQYSQGQYVVGVVTGTVPSVNQVFQAQNNGVSGATTPPWLVTKNSFIADNGIQWAFAGDLGRFQVLMDGYQGWEEYVIVDAAIKCRDKMKKDSSVLMNRKAGLRERLFNERTNRDAGEPIVVTDSAQNGLNSLPWPWMGGA